MLEISQPVQQDRHGNSGVIVEDIDSCMIKFSRCCTPVPGDDIVGFITKGYGVSIHRRDCPNARAANNPDLAARWVNVSWITGGEKPFATTLEVLAEDRDGLLLNVSQVLTAQQIRMKEIIGRELPGGRCGFTVTFEVKGLDQLTTVMNKLRSIEGVVEVKRGQN